MTNNNRNESPQNNNDGTPAPAEMNPAVWEQILQVIAASVAWGQSQSHNASQCGSPGSPEPPEPCGPEGENNNNGDRNFSWKPADIGLFYPNMLKNWGDGDVVDKDNKNYYRNVYSFTNQVRVAAATRDAKQIRQNLDANLREEAELWWNTQLSEVICLGLVAHPNSVKEWCKALEKRFKVSPSEAWNKFTTTRYTLEDVRSHRSPTKYVITLMTAAKSCGQGESEFGLMIQAWMHINMPLHCDIDELKNGTIIEEFVNILLVKQANWYDSYSRAQLNRMIQRNQQGQYNSDRGNRGQNVYNRQPPFVSYYQPYQPARYRYSPYYPLKPSGQFNNQLQQQNSYQQWPQGALSNAQLNFRPSLQITSENERLSPEPFIPNQRYANQNRQPFNQPNHWGACDGYVERGCGGYGNQAYWSNENQSLEENPPTDDQADYQNFENVYYNGEYHEADMSDIQDNQHNVAYKSENTQKLKGEGTPEVDKVVDVEHVTETHILCRTCKQNFLSKNKLHLHLHAGCQKQPKIQKPESPKNTPTFIKFTAKREDTKGYEFRGWRYATALTRLTSKGKNEPICLNTECIMSLVNREFLMKQALKTTIKRMPSPIQVKGIETETHQCKEYADLAIYLSGDKIRTTVIEWEVHIVKDLKAKMLVGLDILGPEKISIMMNNTEAVIKSCNNIRVPLTVHSQLTNQVKKTILSEKTISIPSRSYATVNVVKTSLPKNQDLLFKSECQQGDSSVYAHIVDHTLSAVQVQNDTDMPLIILRKTCLSHVIEYEADGCYLADLKDAELAASIKVNQANWVRTCFCEVLTAATAFHLETTGQPERKIGHEVTVYGSSTIAAQVKAVIHSYPHLWEDCGNVTKVSEKEWMNIPLIDNWEAKYKSEQAHVYPISQNDWEVINKAFDKLQLQGRLKWTKTSTPFTFLCFVVWKNLSNETRKERVVVDIWALNKITMSDAYLVPSQADILAAVHGVNFIFTVDCSVFFYQWRVKRAHRHRLTVVLHQGQKTFKVAVMGYRNSSAYIQRMINRVLQRQRAYARAYVDNIVIFSNTLEEHLKHLHNVFVTLKRMRICLAPEKSFLTYPFIQLLGQWVDVLGLATLKDKLVAIAGLCFSISLSQLEKYLGLTGYLRQYIPKYAAIVKPLQLRKTFLNQGLRAKEAKGNARKRQAITTRLNEPTSKELNAFHHLQTLFFWPTMLVHFLSKRQLYVDLDAFKEFEFEAHVYHTKKAEKDKTPQQKSMEPILFLSQLLTDAKTRYWPTELEVAELVWVLKKTRHLIEAAEQSTIMYTDHAAAVEIEHQFSLNTTAVEKLNLRLVRASEYLQRFQLKIQYKPGKTNIIPDALSRLPSSNNVHERLASREYQPESDESILEALQADVSTATYAETLVKVSPELQQRLKNNYTKEPRWGRILKMLNNNNTLGLNAAKLPYELKDGLVYYKDIEKGPRLCIPHSLHGEVFKLAHDEMKHSEYACTHERLTDALYIYDLFKNLHEYLQHCPQCQLNQTPCHKPYGALQPILSLLRPFHTLTIDFILALSVTKASETYETIMSVTDKFSKAVTLIPERNTMTAEDWAICLLNRLTLLNWGLSRAIISDWDRKFFSNLWKGIFKQLKVDLLYLTAYHSQTDSSFKTTNKTVEIALQYWIMTLKCPEEWPKSLPRLQAALNNSTKYSSTQ